MSRHVSISVETRSWLEQAGFKNYCFISYPHSGGYQLTEFAERIKDAIVEELTSHIPRPIVYLDSSNVPPGAHWPETLSQNLRASIAMVAVLAPIYLEEEHAWCGRELAAMAKLGHLRLPNTTMKPIIPVLFRQTALPYEVAAHQAIDLSRISLKGRRYYSTEEFRSAIMKIVAQIIQIAILIRTNECRADRGHFKFPSRPRFLSAPVQPPPLRTM
jgi:hypothetical protein